MMALKTSIAGFMLLVLTAVYAADNSPQKALSEYLQAEFTGDVEKRASMIFLSPQERVRIENEKAPVLPQILEIDYDDLVLIDSVKKLSCNVQGREADCLVEFQRIGSAYSVMEAGIKWRKYSMDTPSVDTVRYHMKAESGGWVVVDPPVARIGVEPLIDFHATLISRLETIKALSSSQEKLIKNSKDALQMLTR